MREKLQAQIAIKLKDNEELSRLLEADTAIVDLMETQDITKESIQSKIVPSYNTNKRLSMKLMQGEGSGSSRNNNNRALTVDDQRKRVLQLNISTMNDKDTD